MAANPIDEAVVQLRRLADVIRKHGTVPSLSLEHIANTLTAAQQQGQAVAWLERFREPVISWGQANDYDRHGRDAAIERRKSIVAELLRVIDTAPPPSAPVGVEAALTSEQAHELAPAGFSWDEAGAWAMGYEACRQRALAQKPAPPSAPVGVESEPEYRPQTGEPPKWFEEWFIAKLDTGARVVLSRLPEEYPYDYTTADNTYYKASRLRWWMQFPDSQFKPLEAAVAPQPESPDGKVVGVEAVVLEAVAEWEECKSPLAAQQAMFKIANDLRANEADRTLAQQPAAVDEAVDFEIHAGGEYFASVGGPRERAWKEAMHYVSTLHPDDGEPEVFEVTRRKVALATQHQEPTT